MFEHFYISHTGQLLGLHAQVNHYLFPILPTKMVTEQQVTKNVNILIPSLHINFKFKISNKKTQFKYFENKLGFHLPTPPPTPAAILKLLEYLKVHAPERPDEKL